MQKFSLVLFAMAGIILAACASIYEEEPVGIGKDYSELKKSPCACLELKKAPELPEWLT